MAHNDPTPRWGWREWSAAITALVTVLIGLTTAISIAREEGRVTRASLEGRLDAIVNEVRHLSEEFVRYIDVMDRRVGAIESKQDDVRERLRVVEDRVGVREQEK